MWDSGVILTRHPSPGDARLRDVQCVVSFPRRAVTSNDGSPGEPVRVCSLDDLPVGEALRVSSISPPVAVFRTADGAVYAIDDTCTHQDASLADGWVEGCQVE